MSEVTSTMGCIEQVAKWNKANSTTGETQCYYSSFIVLWTFSQFFQLLTLEKGWGKSLNATGKSAKILVKLPNMKVIPRDTS